MRSDGLVMVQNLVVEIYFPRYCTRTFGHDAACRRPTCPSLLSLPTSKRVAPRVPLKSLLTTTHVVNCTLQSQILSQYDVPKLALTPVARVRIPYGVIYCNTCIAAVSVYARVALWHRRWHRQAKSAAPPRSSPASHAAAHLGVVSATGATWMPRADSRDESRVPER